MKNKLQLFLLLSFVIVLSGFSFGQTTMTSGSTKSNVNVIYVPFDFTTAAEKAKKASVYIEVKTDPVAQQKRDGNNRRQMPRDLEDFFDLGQMFKGFGFDQQPSEGKGSGVILSTDGYIVTNNHVVKNMDEITIKTYDDRKLIARKIGVDPSTDLALLKVDATDLFPIEMGNSDALKVGEWVLAVGNPYNLDFTVTSGIVSAKGRNKLNLIQDDKHPIEEFIQTDAAVNPGNSGGALVDVNGKLVGINTAIYSPNGSFTGYSFAIPVSIVQRVMKELKETKNNPNAITTIERVGSLGLEVHEIDQDLAKEQKLPSKKGLLIKTIQEGSIADYAGLIPDDIILQVDGKEVNTFDELISIRDEGRVGQILQFKIMRDGEIKLVPVKLRKKI